MKEDQPKRAGVINIGSSSIKLLIGEGDGEEIRILESLRNIVPLGASTFNRGRISQEMGNRTLTVLENYGRMLRDYEVSRIKVIATTAIRESANRDIFVDTVKRKTGFDVDVLTPGDVVSYIDAYLYHRLRDTYPVHDRSVMIAELGAGSLDLSVLEKGFTLLNEGLPLGTLRLNRFLDGLNGSRAENLEAVREHVKEALSHLKRILSDYVPEDLILIDDSYSPLLHRILPDLDSEPAFFRFDQEGAQRLMDELSDKTGEQIARDYGMPPEMAELYSVYAILLNSLFDVVRSRELHILKMSLTEAILANIVLQYALSRKYQKTHQLVSLARFIGRRFQVDLDHAGKTAWIAEALFKGLKDHMGLKAGDLLYLTLAAWLHDIGLFVSMRSHHKHSEHIISSMNLSHLSRSEINMIACVARYHRKAPPLRSHMLYNSLPPERKILVQKLGALLRIANALDKSHRGKTRKLDVNILKNQNVTLTVRTSDNFMLEAEDFQRKKSLFEEITGSKINLNVRG